MRMGDKADTQISTISSGSLALDNALGVGGYPRGRICVEVYGPRKFWENYRGITCGS